MTDLNSLIIFAKVVEAKSFSEAARLLKMPTSTVSRRVADLEAELQFGDLLAQLLFGQFGHLLRGGFARYKSMQHE